MTTATAFNKETLDNLQPQISRYDVSDPKIPGLRLTVFPGGIKTFYLLKRIKKRIVKIKIGRYPQINIEQARGQAKFYNAQLTLGKDLYGILNSERSEMTFCELYDQYYNQYATIHNRSAVETKRIMELHFFTVHGNKALKDIRPEILRTLHGAIAEKNGKPIANRIINHLSTIYNFGIKNKYFSGENPCLNVERYKISSRDRFLGKNELAAFFDALGKEETRYQDYFSLLLFTGARKSNLLSMQWNEVDLELKRWRISEEKAKNKNVNIVQLVPQAVEILTRRKKENDNSDAPSLFVFPGPGRKGHFADPKKAFHRIKKRMAVENFRIHDLRRTLGSYMAISGASLSIIGEALNHKDHRSTAIYARLSQEPISAAVHTAVDIILGGTVESIFAENGKMITVDLFKNKIKFSDLLAN